MDHFLARRLFDYKIHESQIIKIHEKCKSFGKVFSVGGATVNLDQIALDSKNFSKALASDLKSGHYKIEPGLLRPIIVKGKERVIFKFNLTDTILHASVSEIINDHCQQAFSKNLHSYIKGRNYWKAIQKFAFFCKRHFSQPIPQKEKGIYVLRRDIANYTDTIPVDEVSPLWDLLRKELGFPTNPSALDLKAWDYVVDVIRAEVKNSKEERSYKKISGVPTGSPISTTLFNIYMVELDRRIDSIAPAFYARYGDDLIVADPNLKTTKIISKIIEEVLSKYGLESKKEKEASLYLTIPGRHPDPSTAGEYIGRDRLTFLGCDIMARGTIAVSSKLEKEIIQEIKSRLDKTEKLEKGSWKVKNEEKKQKEGPSNTANTIDAMLPSYCKTINKMFDPENPLAHKSAGLLRFAVTDRHCLKRLDYSIARAILQKCTNHPSVKGFRKLSIRDMRNAGVQSLVNSRNEVGKKKVATPNLKHPREPK